MSQPPSPPEYATPVNSADGEMLGYAHADMPVDPGNPWVAIWFRPRELVRRRIENDLTRPVAPLILVGAVVWTLPLVASNFLAYSVWSVGIFCGFIATAAVAAAVVFVIVYFVVPKVLVEIGRWFDGTGDPVEVRMAVAFASIPSICATPVAVGLAVAGLLVSMIFSAEAELAIATASMVFADLLAWLLLNAWSIVALVPCLAAAHRSSLGIAVAIVTMAALGVAMVAALLYAVLNVVLIQ